MAHRTHDTATALAGAMQSNQPRSPLPAAAGLLYAWTGVGLMWGAWIAFVVFLASPLPWGRAWPLPMVDGGAWFATPLWLSGLIDLALVVLFGAQHSVMARAWFKQRVLAGLPPAFERATYVYAATAALLALIVLWQPIPVEVWSFPDSPFAVPVWVLFATGWVVLLLGAWSYGIGDLLGPSQMRAWAQQREHRPALKTGRLYRWLRHPMYVGVLLGVWATPRMTLGHLLLALGLTAYLLIGMRYEERDLAARFGSRYRAWRTARM
ncbi:MAG: NnrU family protein [Hyphomicrobiaceae bacterium]|nr:NnrU family protein [Hyphomicrobiaceae bacterium]